MLNTPKGVKATLAIQCKAPSGEIGDFIYLGNGQPSKSLVLSPIFTHLTYLFDWLKANGWEEMAYDKSHPTGRYIKR